MAHDALTSYIAKTAVAMVLVLQDKHVIILYDEWSEVHAPFECR